MNNFYKMSKMVSKAEQASSSSKMKNGEYELRVLIEATSALSLESDSNIDVKISVTAFGHTEHTRVKNSIGVQETFWGQNFYFTKNFDSNNSVEGQRVLFSVYDHNKIVADSLVGNYDVDIRRIYMEKNHCIEHMWLALTNIERNFDEISGYLKVSMCVIGQGDKSMQLTVEPISSITKEKKVLMSPNIQRKTYQVTVDILEGKNIKPVDGDTVDSEVGVEFGQIFSKTKTIMKNCNPKYNARVYVPLSLPAVIENIVIRINDFNFIQKGQVLGSHYININNLLKKDGMINKTSNQSHLKKKNQKLKLTSLQWVNFYGPQLDAQNKEQKNIHQFFPELATYYIGSVLMKIRIKQDAEPQTKYQELSEDYVKKINQQKLPPVFYSITATITGAINLQQKKGKYKICIRVGNEEMQTDFAQCRNGFCFWNVQKSYTISVEQNQVVPDIFVYLTNHKNKKVCFLRYEPQDGNVLEDQWVKLKPDLAVTSIKAEQAGFLKLGLKMEKVFRKKGIQTFKLTSPLAKLFEKDRKSGKLVIELICAESLIPLDEDGSADPFFTFTYMHAQATSSLKNDTLNPNYFQKVIIEADILDDEGCPPIIVNCYDKDKLTSDFIGSTFIDVGECLKNKSLVYGERQKNQPAWFNLTQNGICSGRFLASFRLLPNYRGTIPRTISLPKSVFTYRLVILGLRGLKSSGIISIKQPYIEFDFENLNIYSDKKKDDANRISQIVKTEPKQMGSSVNICQSIPGKIVLPSDYKYWPSLSARVKDNVLGGYYQPTLGFFSINLQESFIRSKNMRQNFQNRKELITKNKQAIKHKSPRLQGISDHVLLSLRNFIIKSVNYNFKIVDPVIKNKLNHSKKNQKINHDFVVIFPCYEIQKQFQQIQEDKRKNQTHDEIEENILIKFANKKKQKYVEKHKNIIIENKEYMQVGFDNREVRGLGLDKRQKHYRFFINESLQSYYQRVLGYSFGIMKEQKIRRGKFFSDHNPTTNLLRKISTQDSYVGSFKGSLFIQEYLGEGEVSEKEQKFKQSVTDAFNELTQKKKIHLYLYILEAANLPPKDAFSGSDSYLIIKTGSKTLDFSKEYIEDESNPQFFKKVHLVLELPIDSILQIQVWDYDPVINDDLIGTVRVDIENRLHAQLANHNQNNPIETHNIMNDRSKIPQGLLRFWIDLVPIGVSSLYRQFDISLKKPETFEVRVIVWNVKGMPNDDFEDMNDLFATCQFNEETQQTDTHYRTSTGNGSFNWRMVFPVTLPLKNPLMTFKVFDKDLFSGSDYLASGSFSISDYLNEAFETDSSIPLYLGTEDFSLLSDVKTGKCRIINGEKRYDRFEVNLKNRVNRETNQEQKVGSIEVSIEILTQQEAKKKPAGNGRQNPNQHPFLPEPKGRMTLSLNPLTMISQLCGPQFKVKVCVAIIILLCLTFIIIFGVTIGGSFIGTKLSI